MDPGSQPRQRRLTRWLIGAAVLVLLVAALATVAVRHGDRGGAEVGAGPTELTNPTTTEAGAPNTTDPTTAPAAPAAPGTTIPSRLERQFGELQAQTAQIRGLQWK